MGLFLKLETFVYKNLVVPLQGKHTFDFVDNYYQKGQKVLDFGCGGGLTCEPLSRLGARVTGIDFVKKNIEIAINHAAISNLKIKYIYEDLNLLKIKEKYDLILILEVLEHMDDWKEFLKNNISEFLKETNSKTTLINLDPLIIEK